LEQRYWINPTLTNFTLFLLMTCLLGWLLVLGRDLIIPLIIALVIWYVLDAVAKYLQNKLKHWLNVPYKWAMAGAFVVLFTIIILISDMVSYNALELSKQFPSYQQNIEQRFSHLMGWVAPHSDIKLERLGSSLTPASLLKWATSLISNLLASLGLITIYLIFIFVEQPYFEQKFSALFSGKDQREHAQKIRNTVMNSVGIYLSVMTWMSVLTGVLSSIVLYFIGVDYPVFWGFIIFLTNYIPNIGALIGVLFPATLALVQFDTSWQFIAVIVALGGIQFILGNVVEPRLMGNSLNLSGLAIVLALGIWGAIWGVTGMLLAVPITVMLMIIFAQFPATRPLAVLLSSDGKVDDLLEKDSINTTSTIQQVKPQ
jgi:predicted PurR-regulated permease PerM